MKNLISCQSALAINGGEPVRKRPMPSRVALGSTEEAMVLECLKYYRERGSDPGYQGYFEELYCNTFQGFMGGGYADAVATGSAALYISIAALKLPKNSHILVSPITDPGTLSAIILNGLVPKLIDSAPQEYGVDSKQLAARIDSNVSAAIIVHSVGKAAPMDAIVKVAHSNGLKVIEDCSQAHGAIWMGQKVGTFGDISAFSTMYRKAHMTGASGGLVYSRDQNNFKMALAYADRGKPRWRTDFDDRDPSGYLFPALNLHTDEITCAIGVASLARLERSIAKRVKFIELVKMKLTSNVCKVYQLDHNSSPFIFPIYVDESKLKCNKLEFANAVLAEGIPLNPNYKYLVRDWMWLQPYMADTFDTVNARAARDSTFCLYLNEKYGEEEANDIACAISKVEKAYLK